MDGHRSSLYRLEVAEIEFPIKGSYPADNRLRLGVATASS